MSVELAKDEMLASAVAGLPKVIDLIAACPFEDRRRAFEAAEQSYLKTARGLGYEEADAQQWAEAVMHQLRQRFVGGPLRVHLSDLFKITGQWVQRKSGIFGGPDPLACNLGSGRAAKNKSPSQFPAPGRG
jgi:hypothetical protein